MKTLDWTSDHSFCLAPWVNNNCLCCAETTEPCLVRCFVQPALQLLCGWCYALHWSLLTPSTNQILGSKATVVKLSSQHIGELLEIECDFQKVPHQSGWFQTCSVSVPDAQGLWRQGSITVWQSGTQIVLTPASDWMAGGISLPIQVAWDQNNVADQADHSPVRSRSVGQILGAVGQFQLSWVR